MTLASDPDEKRKVPCTQIPWSAIFLLKEWRGQSTFLKQVSFLHRGNVLGLCLLLGTGLSALIRANLALTYFSHIFLYTLPATDQPLQEESVGITCIRFLLSIRNAVLEPLFNLDPQAAVLVTVGVWLYASFIFVQLAIAWDFDFRLVVWLLKTWGSKSLQTHHAALPDAAHSHNP